MSYVPPPATVGSQLILEASADGFGRTFTVPSTHNWVEVVIEYAPAVSAGTVHLVRIEGVPQGGTCRGLAGSASYNVRGARIIERIPPGARVQCELDGHAGTGSITAVLVSWRQ